MNFTDIAALRTHRDALLEESDKWFLEDWPLKSTTVAGPALKNTWKGYRSQLREWPALESDLSNATVPTKPPH